MHLGRTPAVLDKAAVDHFLENPGPAPGRIFFVAGGLEGRAHDPSARRIVGDALADAGATMDGLTEIAVIMKKSQSEAIFDRTPTGAAQVVVDRTGFHQNARIEQVERIEDGLDLPEQVDGVG